MSVKTSLSATNFPIKSVKLFSCGGAEVTRVFPLDLTGCPNESLVIEISELPNLLGGFRPPSVTTGSTDLLIMDYYHSTHNSFSIGPPNVSSDLLRDLNAKCTRLEDERQLRQKGFAFLSIYMDSLAQGKLANESEPAQLVTLFDEFVELGRSRSEIIAVLDQQIIDIQHEIMDETKRLQREYSSLATTVTVVLAPVPTHATSAELELVYRVQATCKPMYEVYITTSDNVPSSSVVLNYRCQISQRTEENWDNVQLVVTTAKPDIPLAVLPESKKILLVKRSTFGGSTFGHDLFHQEVRTQPAVTPFWNIQGQAFSFGSTSSRQGSLFGSTGDGGPTGQGFGSAPTQKHPDPSPTYSHSPLFGGGTTTSSSNQPASSVQTSTSSHTPAPPSSHQNEKGIVFAELERDITYAATEKVFIPSSIEAHHVLMATIPLKASFMRVAVPTVDSRVLYTCEIINTSNYVLPSGPIHTYMDKKHVSDSKITDVASQQTIQCSLGVDSAITTEIERHVAESEAARPFATQRKTHTITINVKNTHEGSIGDLTVRAFLPVAEDPRIAVSLREPAVLTVFKSARVSDKCSVRWSSTEECNGGMIEWVCHDVQPGSQALKAAWDIAVPHDFDVIEQTVASS